MVLKQRQDSHFQPKNVPNTFGGRAPPGPAEGAHSAPPDPLAALKGATSRQGWGGSGTGKGRGEGEGEAEGKERKEGRKGGREGEGREPRTPSFQTTLTPLHDIGRQKSALETPTSVMDL
jgi:hypothetical protein